MSTDEQLIESIKKFRQQMQLAADNVEEEQARNLHDSKARIMAAEAFMKSIGLDDDIHYLVTNIWMSWPSGATYRGINNSPDFIITDAGKSDVGWHRWVSLDYAGKTYRFEFTKESISDYAKLKVLHEGIEVLGVSLSQHYEAEYFEWHYSSVLSLIKGSWISDIVEIVENIKLGDKRSSMDALSKITKDHAKSLPAANVNKSSDDK